MCGNFVRISKKLIFERFGRIVVRTAGWLTAIAFLFSGWAAADVVMHDLVPLLEDHERLRDELLPVVQDCPQVAATIRTQDFTEDEFAAVCVALKERPTASTPRCEPIPEVRI